jgi:hypothetical protein
MGTVIGGSQIVNDLETLNQQFEIKQSQSLAPPTIAPHIFDLISTSRLIQRAYIPLIKTTMTEI